MPDDAYSVDSPDAADQLTIRDTSTERCTINTLSLDELDAMLDAIRTRRLVRVQQLEELAKVKSDDTRLATYMRYEKQLIATRKALTRVEEAEAKAEQSLHKLRLLVMTIQMEVEAHELTHAE